MEQVNVTLIETIKVLLDDKKFSTLRDILITMKPFDIAAVFENLQDEKMPILFRILPKELAAETFVEMDDETQEFLIHGFSDSELKEVVDELFVDDAVDLIEEMPANVVKRILRQADKDMRKQINELLKYPEDSAGSIMTTEFIVLRPDMTAEMAIKRIRRTGVDKETIYTCYVTDANNKLIGITTVKDLLLAEDDELVKSIMEENVISVTTLADQEQVAQMFSNYNFLALPVVDNENRLVGIVTIDDAIDVIQEEATEDIEKMAAVLPSDKPYMKTSVFGLYKKRAPWLLILMLSATFTSAIISSFEAVLANKPFVMNVYRCVDRQKIESYLNKLTYQLIADVVEEKCTGMQVAEEHKEFIAGFYKYGFVGVMLDWIDRGMKDDYHKIVEELAITLYGNISRSIENFEHTEKKF